MGDGLLFVKNANRGDYQVRLLQILIMLSTTGKDFITLCNLEFEA